MISLMLGDPDTTMLFPPELQRAAEQIIRAPDRAQALHYGPDLGTPALLEVILRKLNRDQGLALRPECLMLTAGSTQAVDMIARLLVEPGCLVLVEAPTYAAALQVFRDHRIEMRSIPMDEEGLIPGALAEELRHVREARRTASLLYTIPTFHNPTGRTLTESRRIEVLRIARQSGLLIVEDDIYRELSFDGTVPPSFCALAHGEGVLSIGSFSKTLAPGLRLGWLIAPAEIIQRCAACGTTQMGGGASPFTGEIVAAYCQGGYWEPHIARLRGGYRVRRDLALAALARYMPPEVSWTHPAGGFFVWLRLPGDIPAHEVKRLALAEGVSVAAGTGFFVEPVDGEHHLRLAYSHAPPADLEGGIRALAKVIVGYRK